MTIWTRNVILGLAAALLVAGCALGSRTYEFRYRLTILIDTPQGVRSGSSVIGIRKIIPPPWLPGPWAVNDVSGEGVVVNLPGKRTVLTLVAKHPRLGFYSYDVPMMRLFAHLKSRPEFTDQDGTSPDLEKLFGYLRRQKPTVVLPEELWPQFVYYRDPGDFRTVELVDPSDFDEAFGPGVRVKSVVFQVTDDEVTERIAQYLPDFGAKPGFAEWYSQQFSLSHLRAIGPDDFRMEYRQ
jgi:hypothetical protein